MRGSLENCECAFFSLLLQVASKLLEGLTNMWHHLYTCNMRTNLTMKRLQHCNCHTDTHTNLWPAWSQVRKQICCCCCRCCGWCCWRVISIAVPHDCAFSRQLPRLLQSPRQICCTFCVCTVTRQTLKERERGRERKTESNAKEVAATTSSTVAATTEIFAQLCCLACYRHPLTPTLKYTRTPHSL